MVKKKIRDTIRKNNLINSGEHIVIGLSGGPDSVCLFSVLKELSGEMGFSLHAVHVNHGFRPGDAEEDQAYVEALCQDAGVPCTAFEYDCNAIARELGLSSEEAGRKVRYDSFRKAADRIISGGVPQEKVKIAVAQNADDQAETVLLRLLRGTGTDGLAGMAYARMEQNVCVIRPLLDTWRSEIEEYCRDAGLDPRTDKTNLQPIYTRNKVRLQLIPYLEENFNPNIMEALGRLSRIAGADKEYLWQQAEAAYSEVLKDNGTLDQASLAALPDPVKYRVIMKAFREAGLEQNISAVHLEAVAVALESAGESKTIEFPDGYKMAVRYGEAVVVPPKTDGSSEWKLNICIDAVNQSPDFSEINQPNMKSTATGCLSGNQPCRIAEVVAQGAKNSTTGCPQRKLQQATFDYEKITAVFGADAKPELRSRREGDFLPLKKGRKKLQDLLVDEKVPRENRDKVKIAAIGSEILWIPEQPELGFIKNRYNPKYKLDIDTKKALILELICEI